MGRFDCITVGVFEFVVESCDWVIVGDEINPEEGCGVSCTPNAGLTMPGFRETEVGILLVSVGRKKSLGGCWLCC